MAFIDLKHILFKSDEYKKTRRVLLHVAFWMTISLLSYLTYRRVGGDYVWIFVLKEMLVSMTLFYAVSWVIAKGVQVGNIYRVVGFYILGYIWWVSMTYLVCYIVQHGFEMQDRRFRAYLTLILDTGYFGLFTFTKTVELMLDYIFIMTLTVGPKLVSSYMSQANEKTRLERDHLAMELNFLKSQVSPHFLFNTLNSIYRMAEQSDPRTPDTIYRLSGMMRYLLCALYLIMVCLLVTACDSSLTGRGKVIDRKTGIGLQDVTISVTKLDTVYTDSAGFFSFSQIVYGSNISAVTNPQLLFTKEGYRPYYVELISHDSVTIEMEPLSGEFHPKLSKGLIPLIYSFNKYGLSLLNLGTIVFLIFNRKIRWRFLWLFGVLFINFTISVSYLDGMLTKFDVAAASTVFRHYWTHPFTVRIVLPIVTVIFWCFYFFKFLKCKKRRELNIQ